VALPIIKLDNDDEWKLTEDQLQFFFNNCNITEPLTQEAVEKYKISTGWDHSWIANVKNMPLIYEQNLFSVAKAEATEEKNKKVYLDYFPQFQKLYDFFDHVYTADISLIEKEVYIHNDGVVKDNPHGYALKVIVYGDTRDFYICNMDGSDAISMGRDTNVILIDNSEHTHYTTPNPHNFIVLFVNGVFNDKYNKLIKEVNNDT